MLILWSILSTIGLIVAVWYFTSVFNPYGKLNYPMLLRKNIGHFISWTIIIIGVGSLIMLYRSTQDSTLFFKIIGGLFLVLIIVKTKLTPMVMPFNDVMGCLYSAAGLRFGGFQTAQFLELTEDIEKLRPGVREKIVAEAHYLGLWLHKFPEIAFFFGTLFSRSLLIGSLCFVGAFLLEIFRFYTFGASFLVSYLCRLWNWIKFPLFLWSVIFLWPEGRLIPIVFVVFLILQGWFGIISTVVMLPIRLLLATWLYRKFGKKHPHIHNMEGLAMQYVIDRWRMKLLPPEEALKFYQMDNKDIEFYKLHGKESFIRAYEKRPFLADIVFFLWLSVVVNVIEGLYFLVTGNFGNMGTSFFWAVLSYILWYLIHNWALKHPKQ